MSRAVQSLSGTPGASHRWAAALMLALLGLCPGVGHADCLDRLGEGATAQSAGQMERAEQIFRDALAIEGCRAPPHGPLLRFSLGHVLASTTAEDGSSRACEAAEQFDLAWSTSADAEVAEAARARMFDARGQCQALSAGSGPGPGDAPASPGDAPLALTPSPVRTPPLASPESAPPKPDAGRAATAVGPTPASRAPASRPPVAEPPLLAFGPRVQAGISGLASGRFAAGEVSPGATFALGLALEYRVGSRLHIWLDPGVTMTSLRYTIGAGGGEQSVVWRWVVLDAVAGVGWHPLGDDGLALLLGAGGGWVVDASEGSGLLAEDGAAIDVTPLLVDAVGGAAYAWDVTDARLRVMLTGGLGLLRLNPEVDRAGWHGYRLSLGVAALF